MTKNRNKEPDILTEMMKFVGKLADGGHSIIYTGTGAFILIMYAFFESLKMNVPYAVPVIGASLCGLGLLFFLLTRK